ncbi:androgen-dependent TFPI-regulating protein-like [Symsagittifera roscoffensis]|uniref:androgen-dependent TFPI-regulating protein-like n=1 Tax=Symsagittifera roscoffensis TaxID=84072 RepID=UPI00307BC2B9
MAMLAAFVRLCVLFILLVMYVHTWSFFVLKLSKEQRGGFEWYHFATMWNFYLQTVYTVIAFFTGVIDLVARKEVILTKRSLQKLTTNLISPLTSFIVIAFWVLFLSNPDLLRHKKQDLPVWFNFNVHLYIIFLPITEFAFLPRSHSPLSKSAKYCLLFAIAYAGFIEYTIVNYNIAPYPMYLGLSFWERLGLNCTFMLTGIPVACISSYLLKNIIYKLQGNKHVKSH